MPFLVLRSPAAARPRRFRVRRPRSCVASGTAYKGMQFRVCVAPQLCGPAAARPRRFRCVGPAAVWHPGLRTKICDLGFAWPLSSAAQQLRGPTGLCASAPQLCRILDCSIFQSAGTWEIEKLKKPLFFFSISQFFNLPGPGKLRN